TRIGPDAHQPRLQGTWVMEWQQGGVYRTSLDGVTAVVGTGRDLRGRRYEFSGETGVEQCGFAVAQTAVYRWKLDGSRLSMTPLHDDCVPRRFVLTYRPLTKVG